MNTEAIASEIAKKGYSIIPIPADLALVINRLEGELAAIDRETIAKFSFPDVIDGFLPYGLEHAEGNPDHPDLCERFCYWRSRRDIHSGYEISKTRFYSDVSGFEHFCEEQGRAIYANLAKQAGADAAPLNPEYSYVQLGIYAPKYAAKKENRRYLMDPHVDGQLLTFILNTAEGLLIEEDGVLVSPGLGPSRMLIMAGKLLELLSDGEIRGINHAVEENERSQRLSLIYFMNPDFSNRSQPSWKNGRNLDFFTIANRIHAAFGNPVYENTAL